LSVSKSNQNELLEKVNPKRSVVVYNCVPVEDFYPHEGEKEDMVITIGAVNFSNLQRKGLEMFVKVARFFPDIPFILIGKHDDDAIEYLKNIAPDNVVFTGFVSKKKLLRYCQQAKVYAQFSYHEGFGVSVAEAMLCECIPVVSRQFALPEVVGDVGFKVDYGDVEAAAEAVKKALQSTSDLGRKARKRVKNNFSMEKREQKLVKILKEML
ncbi:MAG: glycosyltransferase family 4 protein, partial [Candidatus Thermoplasmatota archaeon]